LLLLLVLGFHDVLAGDGPDGDLLGVLVHVLDELELHLYARDGHLDLILLDPALVELPRVELRNVRDDLLDAGGALLLLGEGSHGRVALDDVAQCGQPPLALELVLVAQVVALLHARHTLLDLRSLPRGLQLRLLVLLPKSQRSPLLNELLKPALVVEAFFLLDAGLDLGEGELGDDLHGRVDQVPVQLHVVLGSHELVHLVRLAHFLLVLYLDLVVEFLGQ